MSGVVQVTGELIATRRVGAYHHLTFVAPGVAELARPGQFVALAVGGPTSANLLRRCFSIHKVEPVGHLRRHRRRRRRRARPGHAVADRAARPRPGRHRRPARPAVPAARRAGRLRAGRRRLRQRAAVLARRGAARARLPRRDGARRGHRGPAVRRGRGPAHRRRRHRHHRRRLAPGTAAGCPTCSATSSPHRRGVVYGCGPMAMLRSVTEIADGRGRRRPGRRRGVDGLRRGGLHDLRHAGRRQRRRDPHGALLRRGPGLPRRPGALGRVRDGLGRVPDDALGAPRAGGH